MRIKGFTLIEIIIIIAIISLLFASSIAYYVQFSEQKKLTTEVQKLDDILHLMQKKAMAGEAVSEECESFSGYQVRFSGNTYSTHFCCETSCMDVNDTLINNYTLDSPLTLVPSTNTIYFKPLTGSIEGNDTITIDITNPITTKCSRITIEKSDLIKLTDSCP